MQPALPFLLALSLLFAACSGGGDHARALLNARSAPCPERTEGWEPLLTGLGRVDAVAPHPTQENILFAGSFRTRPRAVSEFFGEAGGYRPGHIFRSLDCGATWEDVIRTGRVGDLTVSPHDPWTVYAAAGFFYRSDDLGQTWHMLDVPTQEGEWIASRGIVATGFRAGGSRRPADSP